jgi:putative component of toxin-antitoxin plasmid stabilization module
MTTEQLQKGIEIKTEIDLIKRKIDMLKVIDSKFQTTGVPKVKFDYGQGYEHYLKPSPASFEILMKLEESHWKKQLEKKEQELNEL